VSAAPAHGLTRANLAASRLVCLERGGKLTPDVWLVECGAGRAVVKDYAARGGLVRATLGPWFVRHECRIYERLRSHPAVPALLGPIDALAFAVEHRGGVRISRRQPWAFSPEFARALETEVARLHARGVVHLDLRHRGNVRAGLDGAPVLIDFASAVAFRPGGHAARWLLPLLALVDRHAVAKWRRRLARQSERGAGSPGARAGGAIGAASEGPRGASRPT
jgi:hypothetical protein